MVKPITPLSKAYLIQNLEHIMLLVQRKEAGVIK